MPTSKKSSAKPGPKNHPQKKSATGSKAGMREQKKKGRTSC